MQGAAVALLQADDLVLLSNCVSVVASALLQTHERGPLVSRAAGLECRRKLAFLRAWPACLNPACSELALSQTRQNTTGDDANMFYNTEACH